MAVSFTVWLKPHLAVTRLDYSEVWAFVLAACYLWVSLRFCANRYSEWIFIGKGLLCIPRLDLHERDEIDGGNRVA